MTFLLDKSVMIVSISRFPKTTTQIWCMSDGKAYIVYYTPNAGTASPNPVSVSSVRARASAQELLTNCVVCLFREHHMEKAGMDFASTETQKDLTSRTQALLQQVIQNTVFLLSGLGGKELFAAVL